MDKNTTNYDPVVCVQRAPGFHGLDPDSAQTMFLIFFIFVNPLLLIFNIEWACHAQDQLSDGQRGWKAFSRSQRERREITEFCFHVITVGLFCHMVLFIVLVMCAQVSYFCDMSGRVHMARYVGMLIATALISGGFLASSGAAWWTTVTAVRGRQVQDLPWCSVFKWEALLVFGPILLPGYLLLSFIRYRHSDPGAEEESGAADPPSYRLVMTQGEFFDAREDSCDQDNGEWEGEGERKHGTQADRLEGNANMQRLA